MKRILISETELVKLIKEIITEDSKSGVLNEQWWKNLGRTILGGTELSEFLSHAGSRLGRGVRVLDDIKSPSEWFYILKKTPGKFRKLKDALVDSISTELSIKGITHTPETWVKKTDREILQDLQKIGVTGDDAISYFKMFEGKHNVKAKVSTATSSIDSITPPTTSKLVKLGVGTDELIEVITKIFGVSKKSSEKLFNDLSKSDFLVEISKKLNISKPKSVDDFISLIKSSPKFTNEVVEEIFSNPTLRNQFDEEILQKLSAMEVESIKKLEKAVKSQDAGVLFHTKKSLKKTTTLSDNIVDGLVKSFKKKHGMIDVSEPLVTNLERKSNNIPNELPVTNKTNTPDTKVSVITPKLGLPGIPEPEIYLHGTFRGAQGIKGRNLSTKLNDWSWDNNVEDMRVYRNDLVRVTETKTGQINTTVRIPTYYELSNNRLIKDKLGRDGGISFSFITPEKYVGNREFANKVKDKFFEEIERLADKYKIGYRGDFYIHEVSESDWDELMNTMEQFLKSPH